MEHRDTKNVFHKLDTELMDWLDLEAVKRDRSRAWMLNEAVRQWKLRLERDREARARRSKRK